VDLPRSGPLSGVPDDIMGAERLIDLPGLPPDGAIEAHGVLTRRKADPRNRLI
jgi:hypothetical protein